MLFDRKLLGQVHFRSIQLKESERSSIHPELVQPFQFSFDGLIVFAFPELMLVWLDFNAPVPGGAEGFAGSTGPPPHPQKNITEIIRQRV